MKAKLTQIRRYWEELGERAQNLEGTITGKASIQQKYEENLSKVDFVNFRLFRREGDKCIGRVNHIRCIGKIPCFYIFI